VSTGGGSYFANRMSVVRADRLRVIKRLGKPVDRREWGMSSGTVNAYYDPSKNEIVSFFFFVSA
jgi:putative endopeptidase